MMEPQPTAVRRFNWKLAVVLVLGAAVLGATMYGLRQWRRTYMADRSRESGLAAFEARDWAKAAKDLGWYVAVHKNDVNAVDVILKYAEAQLRIQPQKPTNISQAESAYRQVLMLSPGQAEASDKVSAIYIQMGMAGDAIPILERRLEAEDSADARQLLAVSLALQGKLKEAAVELDRVIREHPDEITAYQRLAEITRYRPEEVPGSPLEIMKTALARNPASAEAHVALGAYLYRWGGTDASKAEARALYQKAERLNLDKPATRVGLAARLIEAGDLAGAEAQLNAAAAADPSLVTLWTTWAVLARAKGSPEEAGAVAMRAIDALGSESFAFLPSAIELFLYAGERGQAEKALAKIEQADPQRPDVQYYKGLMARSQGRLQDAIAYWQAAAASERATPTIRLALAEAYETAKDLPAALRELRTLATQFPSDAGVRLGLARVLAMSGSFREAADHSAAAVGLDPTSVDARVVDLNVRAHLAASDGADAKAWRQINSELAQLKTSSPDKPVVALLDAEVSQLQGDSAVGEERAKELQSKPETRAQGLLLEAQLLWNRQQRDAALALAQKTLAEYPANVSAVGQLAEMLARLGRLQEAVAVVEKGVAQASDETRRELEIALAGFYMRAGAADKARALLTRLADGDPRDATSRALLIGVMDPKNEAAAQKIVDEIRKIEGDDGFRWKYQQARLWLASPDWRSRVAEAVTLLRSNVKADPHDMYSRILLGIAEEKAGRLNLAIEAFRRAYEQAPDSAETVFYLADALQKNDNLDEAGQLLDDAAKRGVSEGRLAGLRLGQQIRQGEMDLAISTTEQMLSVNPENTALSIFLANLKMRQKDLAGAGDILGKLDQSDPSVLMASVDLMLREGKTQDALALCDRLVDAGHNVTAYLFRAKVLAALGRMDAAEADYRKITEVAGDKPEGWMLLSDFLLARRRTDEAAKAIDRAVSIAPTNPAVVIRAARLYSMSADADVRRSGDELLDKALAANPADETLTVFRAQRLAARGTAESLEEARGLLDRLTAQGADAPQAWRLLAQVSLGLGRPDSALEAISKALASEPDDAERRSLLMLKAQAEKVRWPALAVATLRGLWEKDKTDVPAGLALAQAYRETGEPEKAISVIDTMRPGVSKQDAVALELAGAAALEASGQADRAIERLAAAAAAAPQDARLVIATVATLARADRIDDVISTLRSWQKAHPNDVLTLVYAGDALMNAGEPPLKADAAAEQKARRIKDAAILVLESAAATYPDSDGVKVALATAYQAVGQLDRAQELYRQVLAKMPDNPIVLNNLAWLLRNDASSLKEALSLADRGRKKYPEFAEIIDTRGEIYYRMGKLDSAESELREAVRLSPVNSRALALARLHLAEVLADQAKNTEAIQMLNEALGTSSPGAGLSGADREAAQGLLSKLTAAVAQPGAAR